MLSIVEMENIRVSICYDKENMTDLQPQSVLHRSELKQWKEMSSQRAWNFLRGRYALKQLLISIASVKRDMDSYLIGVTEEGKPFVEGEPQLFCSISHTEDCAVAAIGIKKLGVDVEKIKPRHSAFLHSIADTSESESLSKLFPKEFLPTLVWVIKEASAKADTEVYAFCEYHINVVEKHITVSRGVSQWKIYLNNLPQHIFACAVLV